MAITGTVLENLAKSVDLKIEALNTPTSPGQPQDFQIRPASLLLSPASLALSPLGGLIPTEDSLTSAIPMELSAVWGVEDVEGKPLDTSEAVFASRGAGTSPSLDRTLQTTIMVLPDFVELTRDLTELPVNTRYVTASVTLAVDLSPDPREPQLVKATVPLLRHPITVPAIPIPTVAIFFAKPTLGVVPGSNPPTLRTDQDPEHFALIVLPQNSPIGGITALRAVFDRLLEITGTLNRIAGLAELGVVPVTSVLPALRELGVGLGPLDGVLGTLNAHIVEGGRVRVAFVAADQIPDLNKIDTILDAHFLNDVEAEDTISSFVFLGPPRRQLRCFQDPDFKGAHLTVTTGPACLAIVNEVVNVPPVSVLPTGDMRPTVEQHGNVARDNTMSGIAFL